MEGNRPPINFAHRGRVRVTSPLALWGWGVLASFCIFRAAARAYVRIRVNVTPCFHWLKHGLSNNPLVLTPQSPVARSALIGPPGVQIKCEN